MAYFFIVNPVAGRGRALRTWKVLEKGLLDRLSDFRYAFTEGPGHATTLARDAVAQGYDACIGVGGDGTLHEILPGLVGSETALGCVPAGTGNDYARSVGIPRVSEAQPDWLTTANRTKIDVPSINGKVFLNAAGVGFDAVVADTVNRQFRSLHGVAPYLLAVFKTLAQYRNAPLTITLDGYEPMTQKALLVAAGNMQYYGGGFRICPQADPTDGLLDFCIAGDVSRPQVLSILPRAFKGNHLTHPACQYLRASGAQIDGPPLPIQADGQIIGTLPATFRIQPAALWILRPQQTHLGVPKVWYTDKAVET